jgi:hypothetical protein
MIKLLELEIKKIGIISMIIKNIIIIIPSIDYCHHLHPVLVGLIKGGIKLKEILIIIKIIMYRLILGNKLNQKNL